jgi:hypothetical protein
LEADRRGVTHGGTEQVAGRHVRDAELLGQDLRLRPLPRPGRPQEYQDGHRTEDDTWSTSMSARDAAAAVIG